MAVSCHLSELTWTAVPDHPLVLVPIGSTEQHGPHLPFDTDTAIASAAAAACASHLSDEHGIPVVVAPAIAYGSSGEHQMFPGTISIGHDALRVLLIEVVRSLSHWAGRVVFVNGHGGNVATVTDVVNQMILEQHQVAWVPCAFEGATDAHAGRDETSVMLFLEPNRVDMNRAVTGNTANLSELLPALMASGVRAVSESGVLGDPLQASASAGEHLFTGLVDDLCERILGNLVGPSGKLARPAASAAKSAEQSSRLSKS